MSQSQLIIGMDAKRAFCNHRGLGNYSRLLIEGLHHWFKEDLSLYLFTPKIDLPDLENWPQNWREEKRIFRCFPKGIYKFFPEVWRGYGQVDQWDSCRLHIYHGLSHEIPLGLARLPKEKETTKIKTIVTIHDLIFIRQPELYPWLDRLNYTRKVKYSCERADSIVALSQQTKEDLIEFLDVAEDKISVIYQAIHPRYYKHELKQVAEVASKTQRPYLLFVGAFEERKNILRLIKAFAKAKSRLGDHELLLVGRGRLQKDIQNLITTLSLGHDVRVLTQVSSEDLPFLYQGATALLYPSLFEGFGLPIVEALMSETLVMTSQGGCFPESAGKGAFFIDPYNEEELSETLIEIVGLGERDRSERIQLGLEHCQKFHWKQTSEQLVRHYKTL